VKVGEGPAVGAQAELPDAGQPPKAGRRAPVARSTWVQPGSQAKAGPRSAAGRYRLRRSGATTASVARSDCRLEPGTSHDPAGPGVDDHSPPAGAVADPGHEAVRGDRGRRARGRRDQRDRGGAGPAARLGGHPHAPDRHQQTQDQGGRTLELAAGAALAFHHQLDAYNTDTLIQALSGLRRFLGGQKATLLWDGLPAHRSHAMRTWLRHQRSWLVVEPLPGYAPALNPSRPCGPASKAHSWPTWPVTPSRRSPRQPSAASSGSATPTTWPTRSCVTAACP
jgi:hypothetical protein